MYLEELPVVSGAVDFDKFAVSELLHPTESLPPGHTPSRKLDFIAHNLIFDRVLDTEQAFEASSLAQSRPALVGYLMNQVHLGRSSMAEEREEEVLDTAFQALVETTLEEGGVHVWTERNRVLSIGQYACFYRRNFLGPWHSAATGKLAVKDMGSPDKASLFVLENEMGEWANEMRGKAVDEHFYQIAHGILFKDLE